jgi:hypothetical protein
MNQHNELNKEPKPGFYRHYKGGDYEVVSTASHSETGEKLVVYKCLRDGGSWWVRPLAMFMETVELENKTVQRFQYQGD